VAIRSINRESSQGLLKTLDFLVLCGCFAAIAMMQAPGASERQVLGLFYLAMFASLGIMLTVRTMGNYEPVRWLRWLANAAWCAGISTAASFTAFALARFLHLPADAATFLNWAAAGAFYFGATRIALGLWVSRDSSKTLFRQRIAIVGGGKAAEEALTLLDRPGLEHIEIVGLFDDRNDTRSPDSIRRYQKLGSISDLAGYTRQQSIDLVIVAIPMSAEKRLLQILKRLWELPVDIRISAASAELKLSPSAYSYLGELPLFNAFERPLDGWSAFFKDMMDRVIALAAIIGLAPVMIGVALAVKLESNGPVIFRQKRYGFNNELIEVFKFRSMFTNMSDAAAAKLVTKDDPRVTRVGRFIRKSSLDELPQLFNVLTGRLSLVGPRPHATQAKAAGTLYDQVVDGYFARHKMKPGITGWAQINGWRGETDTREKIEQRVKHDLEYIDKWSLLFDLYILAKTPFSLMKTENAY
jgi:Undecaprenyl-phosphate glucose phosphotransferase